MAVGDPDQSIYAYRGADVHAMTRFAGAFRSPDEQPARVIALRTCRGSGPVRLAASRRVARRLPAAPGTAPGPALDRAPARSRGHRDLIPLPGAAPGRVRVIIASSASQEAAVIADTLRRGHLLDGVRWSAMAALVPSAGRHVPPLRRALAMAGVPAAGAGDQLPLSAET